LNNFYPGVDIVDIDRIKNSIEKYQDKFLSKVFNKEELDYCNSKSNPFIHFSGKFAAKEAIMKAIFSSKRLSSIGFKDISIINDKNGSPMVFIHGNSEKTINISISHTNDQAIAFAILKEK
jgi:holo-[acyl-carrier protein] synthase